MMMFLPAALAGQQTTRKYLEKISSKTPDTPRHHDEVILDILAPLRATLMKGGAVVPSLSRQQRIYFRTWEKWFPCVNRVGLTPPPPPPVTSCRNER